MLDSDPAVLDFQRKGNASCKWVKLWNSGAFINEFRIRLWSGLNSGPDQVMS